MCLQRLDWSRVVVPPVPAGLAEFEAAFAELLLAMHQPKDVAEHERARRHFAVREAVVLFAEVDTARRARAQRASKTFPVAAGLEIGKAAVH